MYRSRLVLVTGIALLILAAAAALTLVPSFVALHVAAPPISDARPSEDAENDAAELERTQLLLREVQGALAVSTSSIAAAEEALRLRPSGIRITRFSYQGGESGRFTLSGDGTRETITGYRDALTQSGAFASVAISVGALVPAEGGPFTIVVSGDF